jgi:hypothetical protein
MKQKAGAILPATARRAKSVAMTRQSFSLISNRESRVSHATSSKTKIEDWSSWRSSQTSSVTSVSVLRRLSSASEVAESIPNKTDTTSDARSSPLLRHRQECWPYYATRYPNRQVGSFIHSIVRTTTSWEASKRRGSAGCRLPPCVFDVRWTFRSRTECSLMRLKWWLVVVFVSHTSTEGECMFYFSPSYEHRQTQHTSRNCGCGYKLWKIE